MLGSGLARAIEPTTVVRFDAVSFADETSGGTGKGVDFVEAPFRVPDVIPAEWLDGGRRFMEDHNAKDKPACQVPGGMRVVRQWMLELIGGYPHAMDAPTLHMRATALVEVVEDFPLWCFTKPSRKRAAKLFGFVPSTKELADFVALVDGEIRKPACGVMRVLDAAARKRKPRQDDAEPWHQRADFKWSFEEAEAALQWSREKRRREFDELVAEMRAKDAARLDAAK